MQSTLDHKAYLQKSSSRVRLPVASQQERGRVLATEHRLLATAGARGADQRLHVVQVAVQGAAPDLRQAVVGPWDAPIEILPAPNVLRFLQLCSVDAQVAVS